MKDSEPLWLKVLILLVIGLGFTGFGAYQHWEELQFRATAVRASGTVVTMIHEKTGPNRKGAVFEMMFTLFSGGEMKGRNYPIFRFEANHQWMTAKASQHSMSVHRFYPGQVVNVYFNPANPQDVRWDYDLERSGLNWALTLLGISMIIGASWGYTRLKEGP